MYEPKEFEIMGQKIKIEYSNSIKNMGAVGLWNSDSKTITIATHTITGAEYDEDTMKQILYHEMVHAILHYLNYDELNSDEKFVDTFGACLHQIHKTMK